MLSSILTATVAFYFLISFACLHCSHQCILLILVLEWIGVSIGGCCYVFFSHIFPFQGGVFDSSLCLPTAILLLGISSGITCLLFVVVIVYVVLLVMIKRQGNRPGASVAGLRIRLIAIAFASFICWSTYWLFEYYPDNENYYVQFCFAAVAVCNPLIFTLLSKHFFKSFKNLWECFCYKCGRPRRISRIYSEAEEEGREPLLTEVASQTNCSSSEHRNN